MQPRHLVLLLCAGAVLVAGCAGSPDDTTPPSPTPTTPNSPGASLPPPTEGTPSPGDGQLVTATVSDVVDGDTIDIRYPDGTTDTVRLLGVDTPEVNTGVSPDEFEGVPDAADRRSVFDRLLMYVIVDGQHFNYELVANGYARVFDSPFAQSDRFYDAEAEAQTAETGVWECRSITPPTPAPSEPGGDGALVIADIQADAPGNDHENRNEEYIVFRNDGAEPLDLTGWRVEDEADHTYRFPTGFTLQPGAAVTLYTGSGSDTASELYWGSGSATWNNSGDTIFVSDDSGTSVIERPYS